MKKIIKVLLLGLLFIIPLNVYADERQIDIHLFYGDGCPHCAAEEEFLNKYLEGKDNIKLNKYEVWYNKDNQKLLADVQNELASKENGVPYTVIGKKVIVGYSESFTADNIKSAIEYYLDETHNYKDYVSKLINKDDNKDNTIEEVKDDEITTIGTDETSDTYTTKVPVFGKINAKTVSLPILAVVLGFVDGFNPCAMWILIFLITMLFNMKNRKKMWILGLTFILTSGIIYLMFMISWLSLATFVSKISYIRLLIALVALTVGIVNLYNYIKSLNNKEEGCEVVDKTDRKKIMSKIVSITNEKKFIFAILGIIVLAASVNIIELMCSIGIPLLFTQILAMNDLSTSSYLLYMLIYILFFLIDDIIVFVISMITLKVTGFSTKYTKYSHLVGGIIMLVIGLLLIIKPEILMFKF